MHKQGLNRVFFNTHSNANVKIHKKVHNMKIKTANVMFMNYDNNLYEVSQNKNLKCKICFEN